jgi:hypothetical protein
VCRRWLLATGELPLVAAGPDGDKLWQCGFDIDAVELWPGQSEELESWPGLNLLGSALTRIRAELRAAQRAEQVERFKLCITDHYSTDEEKELTITRKRKPLLPNSPEDAAGSKEGAQEEDGESKENTSP